MTDFDLLLLIYLSSFLMLELNFEVEVLKLELVDSIEFLSLMDFFLIL